jgi:hypothetical protein
VTSTFHDPLVSPQERLDVAVVIPTICRPSLLRAVESVYRQQGAGRIHVLIGLDKALFDRRVLDAVRAARPEHCVVTLLDLGFSTSERHGGIYTGRGGGALRTILSFAANSAYIAYLDDDNWFAPDHLATLRAAIEGRDWAWSQRWFVDRDSGRVLGLDSFESVGPGQGIHKGRFGGWSDPNTLMIDKLRCAEALTRWSQLLVLADGTVCPADRCVFDLLRSRPGACTGKPTCYYETHASDINHPVRLQKLAQGDIRRPRLGEAPGPGVPPP